MATTKVTVTIADEQLAAIRGLVASGGATSVSGFVQHAIATSLQELVGWSEALSEALDATGGAITSEEQAWADDVLRVAPKRTTHKRSVA